MLGSQLSSQRRDANCGKNVQASFRVSPQPLPAESLHYPHLPSGEESKACALGGPARTVLEAMLSR
jgi:hypothetical protein